MAENHDICMMQRELKFVWMQIPSGNGKLAYLEQTQRMLSDSINTIENRFDGCDNTISETESAQWQDLLCEAYFGKGFLDGMRDFKAATWRGKYRSFQKLESIVKDLNSHYEALRAQPRFPENHLKVGKGLGCLGLAYEGQKLLERGEYSKNIQKYISS